MIRLETKKSQSPLRSKTGLRLENIGLVTCVRSPDFVLYSVTRLLFATLSSCDRPYASHCESCDQFTPKGEPHGSLSIVLVSPDSAFVR